ncbi:hypothetical protein HY624_02885 [Candidatus Uhrbacteria bacterium]|nr:hypothetical protein [Candidatus Uhrbacteria bacterium]
MTTVFRPILKNSIVTLIHAPSLILFGAVVALFGVLRAPLTAAGWPNFFTRALMERWVTQEETTNALLRGAPLSWKTATTDLIRIAQTDTWGFVGLAFVFTIAILVLIVLLYVLPRSVAALIVAGRFVQTRERYTIRRAWNAGKTAWKAVGFFILITQLLPWVILLVAPQTAKTTTAGWDIVALILTFLLTAFMIYGTLYRIIGEYTWGEALRAGITRLRTRLGTTIELTLLMFGTDVVGIALLTILGAIAIVPFLLLLIIVWALQWGTLFTWILLFLFLFLIFYSFFSVATLMSFNYLLWINLFYICEVVEETSFTARCFHAFQQWWKRRRHRVSAP